jgi:hypothetical protein
MGSAHYGCSDNCNSYGSILGQKIESNSPVGDYFNIDEGENLYYPTVLLKLDDSGKCSLYYTDIDFTNSYFRTVNGFQVQGERKEFTGDIKSLRELAGKNTDKNGNGAIISHEAGNIIFRNIENNQTINKPINLSFNSGSGSPVVDLNQNGDGLVIWSGSTCLSCSGTSVYARYVKNFNPQ